MRRIPLGRVGEPPRSPGNRGDIGARQRAEIDVLEDAQTNWSASGKGPFRIKSSRERQYGPVEQYYCCANLNESALLNSINSGTV